MKLEKLDQLQLDCEKAAGQRHQHRKNQSALNMMHIFWHSPSFVGRGKSF
jgi:hypothetical protein